MDPYTRQLKELYSKNIPRSMRWTLEGSLALSQALGEPHRSFKTIHVTGTNGKGSVCTKIARQLQISGYSVGLFTSPHISTFRERIQVNGEMIDKRSCQELLERLLAIQGEKISFFDYVTHLALLYFQKMRVDVALIEVGVGGRLDSTNIIEPLLSIITTVGFDHCDYLGDTLEEIAREKGGIIKRRTPILIGPDVPKRVIEEIAREKEAPLYVIENRPPHFDLENQNMAKEALKLLATHFTLTDKEEGLIAKPPCRMLSLNHMGVDVIIDVAHNTHGIESALRTIRHLHPLRPFNILFGLSASKDLPGCIDLLNRSAQHLYPVKANSRRASPVELLLPHLKNNYTTRATFKESLDLALSESRLLVILGSIFLMDEVRDYFGLPQERDPFELNEQFATPAR